MVLAQVGPWEIITVIVYLMVVGYLGWMGYRQTKTAADYMVAGRKVHPFVMAMSYGATFISTSAIVGFGGVAGWFGMSLLWLTFLNIFVGIFIAFVFLGGPTRRLGHRLDAHTFPEMLGRRYKSKFIQIFAGLIIFLFIPLYAAAVLIGGCKFIEAQFAVPYNVSLLVFSTLVAAYVVIGGLKGVMYTDALQGTIMFVGMVVLLVWTYVTLGGVTEAHQGLTDVADQAFGGFKAIGQNGWAGMPEFGWGDKKYNLWWIVVSTITLGVGIGVLAQPQLAVRFMTVKSKRELNRAVLIGGVFILIMTGVAFTVGSLSNLYFLKHEAIEGAIVKTTDEQVIAKEYRRSELTKTIPCRIWHIDKDGDQAADTWVVAGILDPDGNLEPMGTREDLGDGRVRVRANANAFFRGVRPRLGGEWLFDTGVVIPTYIKSATKPWFGLLFMLTLLAAAMSTLSSQFHAVGTSIGRDVYEQVSKRPAAAGSGRSVLVVRIGILIGLVVAVLISYVAGGGYVIARATAIFFGLCASAFLPAFVGGLFWKRMTRAGAIASMAVGFVVTSLWLLLIKETEADAIGIVYWLTGDRPSLLDGMPNWPYVDPIVVALPLSVLTAIVVSLATKPPEQAHLDRCFGRKKG